MKEITGQIKSWDEAEQRGVIEGADGKSYSFTLEEWTEQGQPEIHGGVLVICRNGRDASQVEYLGIEHIPFMKVTTYAEDGTEYTSHSRLSGVVNDNYSGRSCCLIRKCYRNICGF